MTNKLELSIVVVNLNNKVLTLDCLRSIEKEAKDISFEVLVVDNGSNDGSVELLNSVRQEKYWKNRLRLILNDNNTGYARANNQGIKKSVGEYLLLLNNDTLVHKDTLQNLLEFAKNTPDAGVVGARLLNIDGSLQKSCYHFPTIKNAIKEYWFGHKGLFEKFAPIGNEPAAVDSVVGAAFLITPEARKKVGVLDERYFAYFEDIDYCRQTWRRGLKVYYLPDAIITHYHGATFKKLANEGDQWKKLIPGSIIYHGVIKHYILSLILWTGQKFQKK
ncbi:MAG: hypothetical protein ACD_13C00191G0003 [uncultured bacterium]|nr:MAG: hypothetical protein ACD_13C00191G0003 [uncultured bacterium]